MAFKMLCQSPGASDRDEEGRCSVLGNSQNGVVLSMILGRMNIGLPWEALRGKRRDEVNLHLQIHFTH